MSKSYKKFEVNRASVKEIVRESQELTSPFNSTLLQDFSKRDNSKESEFVFNSEQRKEGTSSLLTPEKEAHLSALKNSVRSAEDSTPFNPKRYLKRPIDNISSIAEEPEKNEFTQKVLINDVNYSQKSIEKIKEEDETSRSPTASGKKLTFGDSSKKVSISQKPIQSTDFIIVGSPGNESKKITVSKEKLFTTNKNSSIIETFEDNFKSQSKSIFPENPFTNTPKKSAFPTSILPNTDSQKATLLDQVDPKLFSFDKKNAVKEEKEDSGKATLGSKEPTFVFPSIKSNFTTGFPFVVPKLNPDIGNLDTISNFSNFRSVNAFKPEEDLDTSYDFNNENKEEIKENEDFENEDFEEDKDKLLVFTTRRLVTKIEKKVEMNDVKISLEEAGLLLRLVVRGKANKRILLCRSILKDQIACEKANNGVKMRYVFMEGGKPTTETVFIEAKCEENRTKLAKELLHVIDG